MVSDARRREARRTAGSRDMVNSRGRMVLPSRGMACRTMSSASISPLFVRGAAITEQRSSVRRALVVSSSGSPGPTPTP